jgi:tetratricopeptide (TPR) repeat protein
VPRDQEVAGDVPREPADANPADEAAIELALEAVRAADHAGLCAGVLEITAVLSADGVRRELLHAAGQTGVLLRGRRVAAGEVDQALTELADRSLLIVSPDRDSVIMPGPVAHVVRARLAQPIMVCWAAASMLEARASVLAGSLDRAAVRDLSCQVTALQENAAPAVQADERLSGLLLRLRFWVLCRMIELDSMPQAIEVGEPLTAELERVRGPDHPETLNARNSLAAAYQAAGRAADAIPLLEHTLVARERVLGPNHPDTLTSQSNLAASYQDASRHAEAILLFKLTLAARERLLGADHPSTLNSRASLAAAYRAMGRVSAAIPLLEHTLAVRERVLGADHPDVQAARDYLDAARQEADPTDEPAPAAPPAEPPPAISEEQPPEEPVPDPVEPPPAAAPAAEADDHPPPGPPPVPEPSRAPEAPEDISKAVPLPGPEPEPAPLPAAVAEESAPELRSAAEPELPSAPEPEPPAASTPPARDRQVRRRRRVPSLVAAVVVLLAAGSVAVALFRPHAGYPRHGPVAASRPARGQAGSTAAQLAAVWVAHQVARSAIVACDPQVCSALVAQGVPAANLLILRTDTTSPLAAQVVVVTPTVRSQFGMRLDSVYAPSVIADFGSGPDQVSVQVVAKDGPAAYLTALRQDVAARKVAGAQLLANKRIRASAEALAQLAAGAVDSRLLIMLPALAAAHPVQILAFGDPGPGAGPGVPLCSAYLSGSGQVAAMTGASYLSWLTSFVRAQLGPFDGSMAVLQEVGQPVVRVVFAQPSPLGLLAHT